MKTHIICIVSLLLLCISCTTVEQQPRDFFEQKPRVISINSGGWYTFQVVMPDNWKIVDAQLNLNSLNKEFDLHLEFDRGKGIEEHSLPVSFPIEDFNEDLQFSGANRVNGSAFLHFIKKDPHIEAKPSLGKSRINKDSKFHEIIFVFRSGNQLMIHFSAENTPLGNFQSHNLRHYYYGETEINDLPESKFKLKNGELQFNFGKNYKGNRNFSIHELVKPHEEFSSGSVLAAIGEISMQLTSHYELNSKQK